MVNLEIHLRSGAKIVLDKVTHHSIKRYSDGDLESFKWSQSATARHTIGYLDISKIDAIIVEHLDNIT